jgi:probable phosphoglycerate mutase
VRHGESTRNYACQLARDGDHSELERQLREGQPESEWPLTEEGWSHARAAGAWLRQEFDHFDAGYCSPFQRTVETAEGLGLPVEWVRDARLRERDWGTYPDEYDTVQHLEHLAECGKFEWRSPFPGAQSLADLVPEAEDFLRDIQSRHPSGRVVIVTHGGRMGAMERVLEGHPHDRAFWNCCVWQVQLADAENRSRIAYPAQPDRVTTPWRTFRS